MADAVVAEKSSSEQKVCVRYYGGGVGAKKVARCASCGSAKGSYSRITSELISFASDDEPNGMWSQLCEAGRDYWVTEKQAEYLLSLTYITPAGETAHKFKIA